ncbi:MAG: hypothetical protein L3K26_03315 [Candidatus Hydrogenedentes bacterium]|nr:hypothetical protein [Candidatus Hydrogenedentota bacterium]
MQQKKLMSLELALMVLCMLPLLVAFSLWRILWAFPLFAAAHNQIYGKSRKGVSFVLLTFVATAMIGMSAITNVWMDSPLDFRRHLSFFELDGFNFGVTWWFVFDLLINLSVIAVGAKLTFASPKSDAVNVTMYISHNGDT